MTATLAILAAALSAQLPAAPFDGLLVLGVVLLGLLLVLGAAIIAQRSLFAAAMYAGAYSLVSAVFFVVMDAVDVAFTEAAVGAGISTVLMLGAMLFTGREAKKTTRGRTWAPLAVVLAAGALLLYATKDMPGFGDGESPANAYLGRAYLVRTPIEVGAPNVVTAVLASYRGYDTLGETVVIFTAGLGVMLLLGLRGRAGRKPHNASDPKRQTASSKDGGEGEGE